MEKIKVLFMQSQSFFGSDSMIHSLMMEHLNRDYFEVHVACNPGSSTEKSDALKALESIPELRVRPTRFGPSIHKRRLFHVLQQITTESAPALSSLLGLAEYAKQHGVQIIHCTEKPRDAFYGVLLARLVGAQCVIHLHVKVEDWLSPLVQWAMKQCDGLIAVSDFVANSAIAMGYDAGKTSHVLNAIDARRWNPARQGSDLREMLNIAPQTPVLAIISRLFPWKGHTELLHALAQVRTQHPNFRLLVVGEDDPRATPGGGSYLAELKQLTSTLNLNEQVRFLGYRRDIERVLAASDIYAMPTFEEPCAVAFLEAMAMAKPVIALDSGGTPQIVEHGTSGLLSAPKDIDGLSENILWMLRNPERRREMGAQGRRRVDEYFTPQRMARDVELFYSRLLGQGRSLRRVKQLLAWA